MKNHEVSAANVSVEYPTKLLIIWVSMLNSLHHCYLCFICWLLNHLLQGHIPHRRMDVTRSWNLPFMVQSFSNSFFWITWSSTLPELNSTTQPPEHTANALSLELTLNMSCMLKFTYMSSLHVSLKIACTQDLFRFFSVLPTFSCQACDCEIKTLKEKKATHRWIGDFKEDKDSTHLSYLVLMAVMPLWGENRL